jgi:hypothetical protein
MWYSGEQASNASQLRYRRLRESEERNVVHVTSEDTYYKKGYVLSWLKSGIWYW